MASRKSKKNNTLYAIVLLLLLLLGGWLLWKVMSPRSATPSTGPQPSTGSIASPVTSPVTPYNYAPIPSISFSMPPEPARPVTPPPSPVAQVEAPRVTRTDTNTGPVQQITPPRTTTTTRRTPPKTTASTRSSTPTTVAQTATPRTPTRPTRPAASAITTGMPGSPIEGMATIRNKYFDPSTGRYFLFCTSDKTSLTYTYEVDPGTFNEANVGLLYNPTKISTWKFVSSQ